MKSKIFLIMGLITITLLPTLLKKAIDSGDNRLVMVYGLMYIINLITVVDNITIKGDDE